MKMGGKIDCYLDIASLYSYLVFLELQKNSDLLASHNVEVEYHPVLLGAINAGSGNRPPWTLPAKASYGMHDARRSIARHTPPPAISFPPDMMKSGMTVAPLRCLHYIKRHHPRATFLAALHHLFQAFWAPPNADLTTLAGVGAALRGVPVSGGSSSLLLFTEGEVDEVLAAAGTEEMKGLLKKTTQEALEKGAFGAPWLWVRDGRGREEPFFGSDRFHFVYKFLGLPYTDVTLLPAGGEKGKL
ncbi:thioredoxin-like protein [Chaetomium fimeti]|uniref:Glutathione S-transferase kappa 1 n=1 Tax=Chaetomium fimeti TaxID=1854472 RepID=A0AAE0HGN7_9PEZI|nr:thioredoxin-like protein [Chaetomium fimeti]